VHRAAHHIRRHAFGLLATGLTVCGLLAACGGASRAQSTPQSTQILTSTTASAGASAQLLDWPEFGLDPQRSDVSESSTGITTANVHQLQGMQIHLPGTVDSSPIYLHGVSVAGQTRNVIVLTTTYGKTIALDASSGKTLWTFTPAGYRSWAGTAQITTSSPLADPEGGFVYAASPNGLIHKLSLSDGREAGDSWPVRITLNPIHQKIASALNVDGPYLLATTGGYIGDTPPYQGHVVLIGRASGRIAAIFNTLCASRRSLFEPSTCSASDSAILSRAGAVVEPGGKSIIFDTGNGPWNGHTDFGDSVIELTLPTLRLRQEFTPTDQEHLNMSDLDLGSSGPALLGHNRVALAGKDGVLRVLSLSRLDGHAPGGRQLGGEVQTLPLPGGGMLFTAPAVWQHDGATTMFIGGENATVAYVLQHGRLHLAWESPIPGTSPILAGGLLYVYDPDQGGIEVYKPSSPHPITKLPGESGHWNSPIVVDGHVIEPEGDANAHQLTGTLEIFSVR
jgi:hypothetical protein